MALKGSASLGASEETAELGQLSQVIGAIYDAALDPNLWTEALRLATEFLDGAAANLFWQHPVDHSATVFHAWGDNPEYVASYFERYAPLNPLFPAATFVPPGVVFSGGDLIPHAEFAQTRFFQEWVAPQGFVDVLGVNLHRFEVGVASFTVRRSRQQGYVDGTMRRKMELLAPHVHRALMISREIEQSQERASSLDIVLSQVGAGVFLVDKSGRPYFVNEAGRAMLAKGDMLYRRNDVLFALDPAVDQALRAALTRAGSGEAALRSLGPSIALTDGQGARHLGHVLPLNSGERRVSGLAASATCAVFVRKTEVPIVSGIEAMAQMHGLTPGEIRVLQAVVTSGSREEIAASLGLSVSTVKTHLAALFEKTGARRRADLVKIMASHRTPL